MLVRVNWRDVQAQSQKLRAADCGWIWFCSPTKLANAPAAPITLSDYRSTNVEFLLSQGCTKQQLTAAEGACGNVDLTWKYYFYRIQVDCMKYHGRKVISKTRLTRCNTHEVHRGEFIFLQHDTTQCVSFCCKACDLRKIYVSSLGWDTGNNPQLLWVPSFSFLEALHRNRPRIERARKKRSGYILILNPWRRATYGDININLKEIVYECVPNDSDAG